MDLKAQLEKQIEKPNWDKIKKLADEKKKQFGGIISTDGALLIAIKELNPDFVLTTTKGTGTEIKGRLISKSKPRFVDTKNVKQQAIRDVFIATEDMGVLSATLWGKSRVELFKETNHNDPILLKDVKVSTQEGEAVLQFFDQSSVTLLKDKDVKPLKSMLEPIDISSVKKSKIGTVSGLVLSVTAKEYRSCPICGKGLSEVEDTYHCPVHREVKPETKTAAELTIDTGKGLVTTTVWAELIESLGMPSEFSKIKTICRVYDANYFKREKASKEMDLNKEVLDKQYPKDMRTTCYSYELEGVKPTSKKNNGSDIKVSEEAINVDEI